MLYGGRDIAKYKHEAAVIDKSGKALLDSISFSDGKDGCEKFLSNSSQTVLHLPVALWISQDFRGDLF